MKLLGIFLSYCMLGASVEYQDFYSWPHQRVALANSSIHFRYTGSGPPILLIHGVPEHSLTWDKIGPILAARYTVIAVDNRDSGDSPLASDKDYSASAASDDVKGVLDFFNTQQVYVVSHDKGVGIATALAAKHRCLVKRIVMSEYPLPGFGVYEAFQTPSSSWTAYSNWQLAFFSIPEVAEFFLTGREREYLIWYFYHASYSGNSAVPESKLIAYTRSVQKPGFLQAAFEYFGSQWRDAAFFNATVRSQPLAMPGLVLGGEASFAPVELMQFSFKDALSNATYKLIPKAGHWIGDEHPVWFAKRVLQFIDSDSGIPTIDLTWLANTITLPQQIAMLAASGPKS